MARCSIRPFQLERCQDSPGDSRTHKSTAARGVLQGVRHHGSSSDQAEIPVPFQAQLSHSTPNTLPEVRHGQTYGVLALLGEFSYVSTMGVRWLLVAGVLGFIYGLGIARSIRENE